MTRQEKLFEIQSDIDKIINADKITMDLCQRLALLYGAKMAFESDKSEDNIKSLPDEKSPLNEPLKSSINELQDIKPSLDNFINNHSTDNLKKLCLEIQEFCQSVYALTKNEDDRKIYFEMIEQLKKH